MHFHPLHIRPYKIDCMFCVNTSAQRSDTHQEAKSVLQPDQHTKNSVYSHDVCFGFALMHRILEKS